MYSWPRGRQRQSCLGDVHNRRVVLQPSIKPRSVLQLVPVSRFVAPIFANLVPGQARKLAATWAMGLLGFGTGPPPATKSTTDAVHATTGGLDVGTGVDVA